VERMQRTVDHEPDPDRGGQVKDQIGRQHPLCHERLVGDRHADEFETIHVFEVPEVIERAR
jgi:hypothetical protein